MSVEDELKKLAMTMQALRKDMAELEKESQGFESELKGYVPIEFLVPGIIKSYKDAVQATDGLTSLKPSVVKALDAVNVKPTKAGIKACKDGLDQHWKEVEKAHAPSAAKDPKVKKRLEAFKKDVEGLKKELDQQDTVE